MADSDPRHDASERPAGGSGPARDPARTEPTFPNAPGSFFDSLPATVWMTDAQMTLTFLQGPLVRQLRVDPSVLVGRTLQALLLDGREDHPFLQAHLTALAGHEASLRVEWGGNLYHARVAPLRDAAGRVTGTVGVHQQIGWLPDDEGTLRESDIRLRRVIDSNMIGIVFGDDQGRITDANEAFLNLAGYEREDLVGDGISWPALTPVEYHQRQIQALQELRDVGRCRPFEVTLIRKDGERVPVMVGAARVSAQRREGVAFVLDMSERRREVANLRGELACADALAESDALSDRAPALIEIFCDLLEWRVAALWAWTPEGVLDLVAASGFDSKTAGDLQRLADHVARGTETVWRPEFETFALPLVADERSFGAIILTGRVTSLRSAELLDVCRRIARRIARFQARRAAPSRVAGAT